MIKDNCWNADFKIKTGYFKLGSSLEDWPISVDIEITSYNPVYWSHSVTVSVEQMNARVLKKLCPRLQFTGRSGQSDLGPKLMNALTKGLADGSIQRGYLIDQMGIVTLPDGSTVAVRGNEVIGKVPRTYMLGDIPKQFNLTDSDTDPLNLVPLLLKAQYPVLLAVSFAMLGSIRSVIESAGIRFQAIGYMEGPPNLGKTVLANAVFGIYREADTGMTAGFAQARSSLAGINDCLIGFRDAVYVIDDLCHSSSRKIERESLETIAAIIRTATDNIPIEKRGKRRLCAATVAMTAEYPITSRSDAQRLILIPIREPMSYPVKDLFVGAGTLVRLFSRWICEHRYEFESRLKSRMSQPLETGLGMRVNNNYTVLLTVGEELVRSLACFGIDAVDILSLQKQMQNAVRYALTEHTKIFDSLDENIKRGNLAHVILEAYRGGAFKQGKKIKNLDKCEAVLYQGDLAVEKEALGRVVRLQPGYKDYTDRMIANELKDMAALVLHSNGDHTTNLVRLKQGTPRVYRIRLKVLCDEAEAY